MFVQSILCTISAILGRKVYLPEGKEYFQKLYPNIWCCTIADSGFYKSTALNKGSMIARKIEQEIYDKIKVLKKVKKSDENNIQIKNLERQNPILSSQVTAEAFMEELSTGQAGMIISNELGGWLQNMNASHTGVLKQLLTDFYDVPISYRYRTRGQGTLIVQEPYITVNGVSTLDWIKDNLKETDVSSGFLARFLLFYPPKNDIIPPALPIKRDNTKLNNIINQLTKDLKQYQNITKPIEYSVEANVRKAFEDYYFDLNHKALNESETTQKIIGPYVKRWTPSLYKISMLMQTIRKPLSTTIEMESFLAAKYIIDYAIKSTTYLFKTELSESKHNKKCREILDYIAKKGGSITWGTLISSNKCDNGAPEYNIIIQTLEESGKIVIHQKQKKKQNIIELCLD